jgi:hypothetical protein
VSQYSEIMEALAGQDDKLDWCVQALKYLLGQDAGWQAYAPLDELELDTEDEGIDEDVPVPIHSGKRKVRGCAHIRTVIQNGRVTCAQCAGDLGCAHNQQALVGGKLVCARCQEPLAPTGVVGRDPGAPVAGQETHGASERNPGTPLVPY